MRTSSILLPLVILLCQGSAVSANPISGLYAGFSSLEKNYEMFCGYQCDTVYECQIRTIGLTTRINEDLDVTTLLSGINSELAYSTEDGRRHDRDEGIGLGMLLTGHLTDQISSHFTSMLSNHSYMMVMFSFGIGYNHRFAFGNRSLEASLHMPTFGRMSDGTGFQWGFFDFARSFGVGLAFNW